MRCKGVYLEKTAITAEYRKFSPCNNVVYYIVGSSASSNAAQHIFYRVAISQLISSE